jgi:hypothetical protein
LTPCRDSLPGHVTSSDAGILAGQEAVNGQLSQPEQSTAGCATPSMRIHVALDEPLPKPLPTGARATVQLYNSEGRLRASSPACRSTW